jgi:hypothetical protein
VFAVDDAMGCMVKGIFRSSMGFVPKIWLAIPPGDAAPCPCFGIAGRCSAP